MPITVRTSHPVSVESLDHLHPRGTALDNSRNRRFNSKLYALYCGIGRPLRILDLGCAGGGFVGDCLEDGHVAVGIEGSDYSADWGRAAWPALGGRALFTADISKQFEVVRAGASMVTPMTFDVITMWEVLEHIRESDLPSVFSNVLSHMEPGGLVITSLSSEALIHHQTVRDENWWKGLFVQQGLTPLPWLVEYFATQFIRGPRFGAEGSFHVIATNDPGRTPARPPERLLARALDRAWYGSTPHRLVRRVLGLG